MFSRMQLNATLEDTARHFGVEQDLYAKFEPANMISAFDHQYHPSITCHNPSKLTLDYRWGLVPPDWKKEPDDIWNHTISAKLEYLNKRYSWRQVSINRCLIPVTAYYEYHWNDAKGKSKTRFIIKSADYPIVALAGLYSDWLFRGELLHTFAVCTTDGNDIMKFVHNKDAAKDYSRMPVMLNHGDEPYWLNPNIPALDFAYPNYGANLVALPDTGLSNQVTLF
jgi:putative SOS response-associated peptidase YedK